jgi:hypothetical protein
MKFKLIVAVTFIGLTTITSPAQDLLNKMKKKAGNELINKIGTKPQPKSGNTTGTSTTNEPGATNPANKSGGGLSSTPPDVSQNLTDAGSAYSSGKYGEARYAVQQAMLGVELEIGNKILKSLPATISGLKTQAEQDQVTSTGYGWAGLTIQRVYSDENDKQLKLIVANNGAWMSAVNMYLSSGGYAQTTGGQQNWKQTKVKGYRSVIEYDESSGYKLSVPVGQSSLVVLEGINFASEQEMMTAGNAIDYDGIKKMLGEQ